MGKRLQTVAAMACLKSLLMVFNVVFWLTGIGLLALGAWLQVSSLGRYLELSSEFSGVAPWLLLGCGALIVVVASFACCCTLRGHPAMLYTYGTFLLIMFAVELVAGTYLYTYRTRLEDGFEQGLNHTMMVYDAEGAEMQTKNLDFMQNSLECCGISGYLDWLSSPYGKVPPSCCIKPRHCNPKDHEQIFMQGCYTKVMDVLKANIGIVAGTAVATAFFPLIGVIFACCLAKNINRAKYEQMA